jgi:glycerol-3-phosphate dehydrogenase
MVEPQRVADYLLTRCRSHDVTIHENTSAQLLRQNETGGFTVVDLTGNSYQARNVVNTLGPWIHTVDIPEHLKGPQPLWCKGFNLITSRQLDPAHGIGIESSDGRLFFCVPRGSGTAIGTWYVPHQDGQLPPRISEDEVNTFLKAFNAAIGENILRREDITAIDIGVLPMERNTPTGPKLIAHEKTHSNQGYIEVLSTKYPTFRSQADAVMRKITVGGL